MSAAIARPLLHSVHLLTFTGLFVTGLLLFLPGLRAAVTGGYSLVIRDAHRWGGVAFVALPVVVVLCFGVRSLFAVPEVRTLRTVWQGSHVVLTVIMSVLFTVTGLALWAKRTVPESIVDVSQSVHDWLTYVAGVMVAAHLIEVGATALVGRISAALATAGPRGDAT